jgi:hypothetical protein
MGADKPVLRLAIFLEMCRAESKKEPGDSSAFDRLGDFAPASADAARRIIIHQRSIHELKPHMTYLRVAEQVKAYTQNNTGILHGPTIQEKPLDECERHWNEWRESIETDQREGGNDTTGFVEANKLWIEKFATYRQFDKWLSQHPEVHNYKKGRRRMVNAAQFIEAYKADEERSQNIAPEFAEAYLDGVKQRHDAIRLSKSVQGK